MSRYATTTSTADSGLLDYLLPDFEQEFGVGVEVVAPIIVGVPSTAAVDSPRRPPDILAWK